MEDRRQELQISRIDDRRRGRAWRANEERRRRQPRWAAWPVANEDIPPESAEIPEGGDH